MTMTIIIIIIAKQVLLLMMMMMMTMTFQLLAKNYVSATPRALEALRATLLTRRWETQWVVDASQPGGAERSRLPGGRGCLPV